MRTLGHFGLMCRFANAGVRGQWWVVTAASRLGRTRGGKLEVWRPKWRSFETEANRVGVDERRKSGIPPIFCGFVRHEVRIVRSAHQVPEAESTPGHHRHLPAVIDNVERHGHARQPPFPFDAEGILSLDCVPATKRLIYQRELQRRVGAVRFRALSDGDG
ncbi:hypothetical protein BV22DRAFT_1121644 [Leucogyrophana mollusca]|uniref:Uncharacterized protein n=1 Tax=Leucogyrophana mollusca TaxID=85980 RepID=A0ACB8BBQ7_9AGAM|nr:hypothetical protein BV22DRAFT_1121644 [Leucogyrophana mollusca]